MHTFSDLYEQMPKKDCGACGNPNCRTMARKVILGEQKPEDCVYLPLSEYKSNLTKIYSLLKEGVKVGSALSISGETGITLIHPCKTDAKLVTAETKLSKTKEDLKYGFLDLQTLHYLVKSYDAFSNLKHSPKLGLVKFNYGPIEIVVYDNGKLSLKKAKDKQDVSKTVKLVSRIMWGSVICSCCGNSSIDCASGACEDCIDRICPVLGGGPPDVRANPEDYEKSEGKEIFERVKKLDTYPLFQASLDNLKALHSRVISRLSGGELTREQIDSLSDKITKSALDFIVKTERVPDATIGLILTGILLDLRNMADATLELTSTPQEAADLRDYATDVFNALISADAGQVEPLRARYKQLSTKIDQIQDKSTALVLKKFLNNTFYMARLLPKPLPK